MNDQHQNESLVGVKDESAFRHQDESAFRTWIWLGIMLGIILFKGFLAFYVVSDMGQPTWAYRPVPDVPAESPYAVYQPLPKPQHIRGAGGN